MDPNRTGYLAVCKNEHGKIYKIAGGIGEPKPGMKIEVQTLGGVYVGDSIYNVSIKPGKIGQYARAAGASCKVLKQDEGGTTIIRLPSSEVKRLNSKNECQRGVVYGKAKERLGTAGANRRLGVRPRVQGVAMNPIDHPNGGKSPSSKVKNL
jgi:large subunit ribosomal protein L2